MKYDINAIEQEMTASGSHWWDRSTLQFFRCRVGEQVYQGPGGIYFVTSETNGTDPRRYTVRQYHPSTKSVDTVGEFCSMTRARAHSRAKALAEITLQEQFDIAMANLDRATTDDDKSGSVTKYGTVDDARECGSRSIIYLSDGGYSRVVPKQYDSGGYWLSLITTGADTERNDEIESRFRAARDMQTEVCRILATEPAGESLDVSTAVYIETTAAQQLAIDIVRNGGRCSTKIAGDLIQHAKRHHKLMEDYCNGVEVYDANDEPKAPLRNVRQKLEAIAAKCLCGVKFSGDPRGCTVKLTLPSSETNDMGRDGWCIPTLD